MEIIRTQINNEHYLNMESSPEFDELLSNDQLLLRLREITGDLYEETILYNLSARGEKVYHKFFTPTESLPDEILRQIIRNVETIDDLSNLKETNQRISTLLDDPKILKELTSKFRTKLSKDGLLEHKYDLEYQVPPQTFQEFLVWYSKSTKDSDNSYLYFDIIECIRTAIQQKNNKRLNDLIEIVLPDFANRKGLIQNYVDDEARLTFPELQYIFDNCCDGRKQLVFHLTFLVVNSENWKDIRDIQRANPELFQKFLALGDSQSTFGEELMLSTSQVLDHLLTMSPRAISMILIPNTKKVDGDLSFVFYDDDILESEYANYDPEEEYQEIYEYCMAHETKLRSIVNFSSYFSK